MNHCEHIQELIAWNAALDRETQAHIASCPRCSAAAAEWLELESELSSQAKSSTSSDVPDGFADKVMARLDGDAKPSTGADWLSRRWVQLALAQVGVAAAVVNLVRLFFSSLLPSTSLGAP